MAEPGALEHGAARERASAREAIGAPDGNYLTRDLCDEARERLQNGECPDGCAEPDWDQINDERRDASLEERYG